MNRPRTTGGDIPPSMVLPGSENNGEKTVKEFHRGPKQSRSIQDIFGSPSDQLDAAVDADDPEKEEEGFMHPNLAEFFQYDMKHKSRGVFLIFNHKVFTAKGASTRHGTDRDRENLNKTAKLMGFDVRLHNDLTLKQLKNKIDDYAGLDYSDCDCFACAVLTHGKSGDIIYAKDEEYSMQELLSPIRKCPTLAGKPKLFFIQACRGTKLDHGTEPCDQTDSAPTDDEEEDIRIPLEADFFIGYSTVEGYYAWRNQENGSWFVQALCFCLRKYHNTLELMQIMTRVNCMVAYDFESNVKERMFYKKKQMPSIVTRLTKEVFLRKNKDQLDAKFIDGRFSKTMQALSNEGATKSAEKRDMNLQQKLLTTKIELEKAAIRKAEAEMKECEIRAKMYELELQMLQK